MLVDEKYQTEALAHAADLAMELAMTKKALEKLLNSFAHTPGNIKGNKAKTDVITFNPDVRDALNTAHNVIIYGHA